MVKKPIYVDNHATTRTDPRVVDAMLPYFTEHFGNAASRTHDFGWQAADAVDTARTQVAALVGARATEIVFTSGATEANNLAIQGITKKCSGEPHHVITVVTEHRAVLDPCAMVEQQGGRVTYLSVQPDGLVDVDELDRAVRPDTILITVMTVNNEIGVIQPIADISKVARAHGVLLHTDAAQALGKTPVEVDQLGVDFLSMSAHKMYGPKGVGALYIRGGNRRTALEPLIYGGGHEQGLRSGTLNVAGIVGFGCAAGLCSKEFMTELDYVKRLRDRLWNGLNDRVSDIRLNGSLDRRVHHNLNVSFAGVDGEALLIGLDDIAASSGSACSSESHTPSHVVKALGVEDNLARASIRFGLSHDNTDAEIDYIVNKVADMVRHLRALSPLRKDDASHEENDPVVARWLGDR